MIQLPTLDNIQQSEFWQFFHLRILREIPEADLIYYSIGTGNFQSEIDLMLVSDPEGVMTAGFLGLNRSWVTGPPYGINPFALDICRSFIRMAIGGQGPASDNFLRLFQDVFVKKYQADKQSGVASAVPELDAYLGEVPEVMRRFPGCDIRLKNDITVNRRMLQVIISST